MNFLPEKTEKVLELKKKIEELSKILFPKLSNFDQIITNSKKMLSELDSFLLEN